ARLAERRDDVGETESLASDKLKREVGIVRRRRLELGMEDETSRDDVGSRVRHLNARLEEGAESAGPRDHDRYDSGAHFGRVSRALNRNDVALKVERVAQVLIRRDVARVKR